MFDIDEAMADVVARASEPTLAAIKLAWWRERLEELDQGKVPAEPRLQAAAAELLPRGLGGAELAELEDGWAGLLEREPDLDRAARTGSKLFELAAKLLGASHPMVATAGRFFLFQKAARRGILLQPDPPCELAQVVFPRDLRPLTALAALAVRDAKRGPAPEPEATPGRALALLRHRLTGRLPRP